MTNPFEPTPAELARHELLAAVAAHTAQRLIEKAGMDEDAACDLGNDLADYLASTWKGQSIYFPGDEAFKLQARDREIFQRFRRGNAHELALEFGVSKVWIYAIYRRVLAEYRKRIQSSLFADAAIIGVDMGRPEQS